MSKLYHVNVSLYVAPLNFFSSMVEQGSRDTLGVLIGVTLKNVPNFANQYHYLGMETFYLFQTTILHG